MYAPIILALLIKVYLFCVPKHDACPRPHPNLIQRFLRAPPLGFPQTSVLPSSVIKDPWCNFFTRNVSLIGFGLRLLP